MHYKDERVIEFSKTKSMGVLAIACVFVLIGYWMLQMDAAEIEAQRRFNDPLFIHGLGVVTMVLFGLCGLAVFARMFERKPGLVLNEAGLVDNAGFASAGLIPWSEIVGFAIHEAHKQKTLIVLVGDLNKYVEVGGVLRRALNRINVKLVGSPIAISSTTLEINFGELLDVCSAYHQRYGKSASLLSGQGVK